MYSRFQHLCNRVAALQTTTMLLCKLLLHSCMWHIKLSTSCGISAVLFSVAKVLKSPVHSRTLLRHPSGGSYAPEYTQNS